MIFPSFGFGFGNAPPRRDKGTISFKKARKTTIKTSPS